MFKMILNLVSRFIYVHVMFLHMFEFNYNSNIFHLLHVVIFKKVEIKSIVLQSFTNFSLLFAECDK